MPTIAAFNLKEKATGNLYSRCICGCGAATDKPIILNSAEEAKDLIKFLKLDGWVPAVYVDDSWKTREREKFRRGEYQVPLWYDEPWYKADTTHFDRYYPHVAKASPDKISITDTPEKGMQDVQTPIAPGKYLKRFFGKVLTADEIKEWANKHTEEWGKPLELIEAKTAEEMSTVYQMEAGFTSCMQKPIGMFSSLLNPTYVYGNGNLVLGYIADRRGKLLARALMIPDRRLVGRVYGDVHRFRAAVKAKYGFETFSDNRNFAILDQAETLAIRFDNGGFIMPYVDGPLYASHTSAEKFTLSHSTSNNARNTWGSIGAACMCARCGTQIKQGRMYRVFRDLTYHDVWVKWCHSCYATRAVMDEENNRIFYYDSEYVSYFDATVDYNESEGDVHRRYVNSKKAGFIREPGGYWLPKDRAVSVNAGASFVLDKKLAHYARLGKAFKSALDNQLYFNKTPVIVDGQTWTAEQAKSYADFNADAFTFHRREGIEIKPVIHSNDDYEVTASVPYAPQNLSFDAAEMPVEVDDADF